MLQRNANKLCKLEIMKRQDFLSQYYKVGIWTLPSDNYCVHAGDCNAILF